MPQNIASHTGILINKQMNISGMIISQLSSQLPASNSLNAVIIHLLCVAFS